MKIIVYKSNDSENILVPKSPKRLKFSNNYMLYFLIVPFCWKYLLLYISTELFSFTLEMCCIILNYRISQSTWLTNIKIVSELVIRKKSYNDNGLYFPFNLHNRTTI